VLLFIAVRFNNHMVMLTGNQCQGPFRDPVLSNNWIEVEGQGWFLGFPCFTKYVKVTWSPSRCLRASGKLQDEDFSAAMITWSASLSNTSVSVKPALWSRRVQPATDTSSPIRVARRGTKSFVWS
jgi:hypothetical protein